MSRQLFFFFLLNRLSWRNRLQTDSAYVSFLFNCYSHVYCVILLVFALNHIECRRTRKKLLTNILLFSEIQSFRISRGKKLFWDLGSIMIEVCLGYWVNPISFPCSSAFFSFCERVNYKEKIYPGNVVDVKPKTTFSPKLELLKWLEIVVNISCFWFIHQKKDIDLTWKKPKHRHS